MARRGAHAESSGLRADLAKDRCALQDAWALGAVVSGRFASQHRSLTTTEQGGDAQSPAQPRAPSIVRKTRSCPSWQRKDPETEILRQGKRRVLVAHRPLGRGKKHGSMLDTVAKPRPGSQGRSPRPDRTWLTLMAPRCVDQTGRLRWRRY